MSSHFTPPHGQHDPATGDHQEDAIDFGAVLKAGAGLAAVTIGSYVLIWGVFLVLARQTEAVSGARAYPLAIGQENRLPPEPRLQTDPKQDLRDLRRADADVLNGYHWVDKNAGVVRIPIAAAMKLTIERGLPSRGGAKDAR